MKRAFDFRAEARRALSGNWGKAVAVGLVATLLTGGVAVVNTGANSTNEGYLSLSGHESWI